MLWTGTRQEKMSLRALLGLEEQEEAALKSSNNYVSPRPSSAAVVALKSQRKPAVESNETNS